jgi:sugar lactone lactonase YvrE
MNRLLAVLILALAGTFQWGCGSKAAPSSPGSSSPTYNYSFLHLIGDYGVGGSANGQLSSPAQLAIYNNTLFVANAGTNSLEKFDLNGNFLATGAVAGASDIWGLAIYNGVLFVGDFGNNNIYKYDINLNSLGAFTPSITPNEPTDLATDSTGRIYMANDGNDTLERCNNNGASCVTVGGVGTAVGMFSSNGNFGIAVDPSGNVYATDQGNGRVEKFNSSMASPSAIILPGTASGSVSAPTAIGVDKNGNLLVSDSPVAGTSRVQTFTPTGGYLATITAPAGYPFSNYNLLGFAFDSGNNVYISDYDNAVVFKYAP